MKNSGDIIWTGKWIDVDYAELIEDHREFDDDISGWVVYDAMRGRSHYDGRITYVHNCYYLCYQYQGVDYIFEKSYKQCDIIHKLNSALNGIYKDEIKRSFK